MKSMYMGECRAESPTHILFSRGSFLVLVLDHGVYGITEDVKDTSLTPVTIDSNLDRRLY